MRARSGKPSDELEKPGDKQMILGENQPTVECRQDIEVMARCHDFVERIKLGNTRLWAAWARLCAVPITERDPWIAKWDDGYARLFKMNERVMVAGWHWCLYLEKNEYPLQWCLVCPCQPLHVEPYKPGALPAPNPYFDPERCMSMALDIDPSTGKFAYVPEMQEFIDAMKREEPN